MFCFLFFCFCFWRPFFHRFQFTHCHTLTLNLLGWSHDQNLFSNCSHCEGAGTDMDTDIILSTIHYVKSSSSDSIEKEGENNTFIRNLEDLPRRGDIWVESWRLSNIFLAEKVERAINHHHCQWKIKNRQTHPYVKRHVENYINIMCTIIWKYPCKWELRKKNLWTKLLLLLNLER